MAWHVSQHLDFVEMGADGDLAAEAVAGIGTVGATALGAVCKLRTEVSTYSMHPESWVRTAISSKTTSCMSN